MCSPSTKTKTKPNKDKTLAFPIFFFKLSLHAGGGVGCGAGYLKQQVKLVSFCMISKFSSLSDRIFLIHSLGRYLAAWQRGRKVILWHRGHGGEEASDLSIVPKFSLASAGRWHFWSCAHCRFLGWRSLWKSGMMSLGPRRCRPHRLSPVLKIPRWAVLPSWQSVFQIFISWPFWLCRGGSLGNLIPHHQLPLHLAQSTEDCPKRHPCPLGVEEGLWGTNSHWRFTQKPHSSTSPGN